MMKLELFYRISSRLKPISLLLLVLSLSILHNTFAQSAAVFEPAPKGMQKNSLNGTIIHFLEQEPGVDPYPVTYTITPNWLRIDDTPEQKNFILFDRRQKVIYSINSDAKQVYQINPQSITVKPPIKISNTIKPVTLEQDSPKIAGKTAEKFEFLVNTQACVDVVTIKGLLVDELKAIVAFKKVMAAQHAKVLGVMPGETHNACDLSKNIFYPALYYSEGFPIVEREKLKAFTRVLTNYQYNKSIDSSLFVIPSGLIFTKI